MPTPLNDSEQDIPILNWEGGTLDCASCPELHSTARCERGHACVHDRYAKRIDRFFKWNPGLSNAFLDHPYFEVRAIACRRADVFHLLPLIADEDETVRLSVAVRLPLAQVVRLRRDPHREVRIRVAMRLEGNELLAMADDEDYYVRKLVARRLPLALLPRMLKDKEWEVRLEAVKRLDSAELLRMCADPEISVRREVAQRMPAALLDRMANDPAWEIRWEVAQRADESLARQMASKDEEDDVRNAANARLDALSAQAPGRRPGETTNHMEGACHG